MSLHATPERINHGTAKANSIAAQRRNDHRRGAGADAFLVGGVAEEKSSKCWKIPVLHTSVIAERITAAIRPIRHSR